MCGVRLHGWWGVLIMHNIFMKNRLVHDGAYIFVIIWCPQMSCHVMVNIECSNALPSKEGLRRPASNTKTKYVDLSFLLKNFWHWLENVINTLLGLAYLAAPADDLSPEDSFFICQKNVLLRAMFCSVWLPLRTGLFPRKNLSSKKW